MVTRPAAGLKAILDAINVGTPSLLSGWVVTEGSMPTFPDMCITLYNSGGRSPEARLAIDYPNVQVIVRGTEKGYAAAEAKARDLKDIFHGITEAVAAPYPALKSCLQVGDTAEMGRDETNRPRFVMNFRLITMPTPGPFDRREAM